MNDIIIRTMCEADLDKVSQLEKECFSEPWSKKSFLESLVNLIYIMVVVQFGDEIIGYCVLRDCAGDGEISNVAIEKEHRNKNIGTKMLLFLMEEGTKRGILQYTLEVRKSNVSAIRLYEKLAFLEEGIRKDFYQYPTEDAIIMWKRTE